MFGAAQMPVRGGPAFLKPKPVHVGVAGAKENVAQAKQVRAPPPASISS
eukprot:COSAG01_NODE_7876_length_3012_cov_22.085479_4_plen_49_part_00